MLVSQKEDKFSFTYSGTINYSSGPDTPIIHFEKVKLTEKEDYYLGKESIYMVVKIPRVRRDGITNITFEMEEK